MQRTGQRLNQIELARWARGRAAWCLLVMAALIAAFGANMANASARGAQSHVIEVFENDHVRVTELFASPRATRPLHLQAPGAIVSLTKSRLETVARDGTASVVDFDPGQISWSGTSEWRSWRVLAGNAHIVFVEVKSASAGSDPPNSPIEPTHSMIVDPDHHHLVLDNEHVRIFDGMAPAGAKSPAHTHAPSVLVSLAKSRFKVTIKGKTRIFDFEPAMVRWTNHFEHHWEIISGDARVIMVEIKSAHGDPQFHRR